MVHVLCRPSTQVLQRQCDALETTVASMELETKGNSQGSTALNNRVRLLRKESRKQVSQAADLGFQSPTAPNRKEGSHNI